MGRDQRDMVPDPITLRRLAALEEQIGEIRRVLGVEDPEHEAEERRNVLARLRALDAAVKALGAAPTQEMP